MSSFQYVKGSLWDCAYVNGNPNHINNELADKWIKEHLEEARSAELGRDILNGFNAFFVIGIVAAAFAGLKIDEWWHLTWIPVFGCGLCLSGYLTRRWSMEVKEAAEVLKDDRLLALTERIDEMEVWKNADAQAKEFEKLVSLLS